MWKFILLAMFYGQDGEILHEFRAPVVLNTEAACREMVTKNTFQKTEVEKNGRKYLVEAKADCIYDPPAQDPASERSATAVTPKAAEDVTASAPLPAAGPPPKLDRPARANPAPAARAASGPVRRTPSLRRRDTAASASRPAPARPAPARSVRASGFFDVWPGDVAGPEYDVPGLGRRR